MKYDPPLQTGTLIKRYKRFLADIRLPDKRLITIHCPNTGSMKHCANEGDEVWFSTSNNEKRKYAHTWELSRTSRRHYIGVNTGMANYLVKEAILADKIPELAGYESLQSEVRYGRENSRIDFLLSSEVSHEKTLSDCYVEVKSVTLLESPSSGEGFFPDAVSARGTKHLRELIEVVEQGMRGVLMFCVQHSGIKSVAAAAHIDPVYAETLAAAVDAGVEVLAYKARMSPTSNSIAKAVPVRTKG